MKRSDLVHGRLYRHDYVKGERLVRAEQDENDGRWFGAVYVSHGDGWDWGGSLFVLTDDDVDSMHPVTLG